MKAYERNWSNANNKQISIISFSKRHQFEIFLGLLIIVGLLLRIFIANSDLFLHDWDERFHALVARNLMHHPFQPTLRANPVADYDPYIWCCNHIWLHKQPLFMWQMAVSMKIFGVSELAMRLPSIIMGTIMIPLIYRIAFLFSHKKIIALTSALFLSFSHFHLEMISGIKGMDHNDVALGFYVLSSIWAYAEYNRSQKWYWAVLIGVFAGCAILNKWLLGLFVFLGWSITIALSLKKQLPRREIGHFILALLVCCCIFIPWQLYILHNWPNEANYVYEFNRRHISEVLEGHEGSGWFYIQHLPGLLSYLWFFIIIGVFTAFLKNYINKNLLISFCSGIFFVFCFFSFIVKTKVDTYLFFVAPLCMILMSAGIYELFLKHRKWFINLPIAFLIAYLSFMPEKFTKYYAANNDERQRKIHNTTIYKNLRQKLPEKYKVVMNVNSFEDVELMFYNNDITAYHWWLSEKDLQKLAKEKIPVAAFRNHGNYNMPEYVFNYPFFFLIDEELK